MDDLQQTLRMEPMDKQIDIGQRFEAIQEATKRKLEELRGGHGSTFPDCKEDVMERMSKFVTLFFEKHGTKYALRRTLLASFKFNLSIKLLNYTKNPYL